MLDELAESSESPSDDHIQLSQDQAELLINHRYGFGVYLMVDGELIEDANLVDSYDVLRDRCDEYPTIQDQLDMIFHDLEDGTKHWQDKIRTIKTKYPKV